MSPAWPRSLVLALFACVPPVFGGEPSWERIEQTQPGRPSTPTPPDENGFWERLQSKAFDDICRHVNLRQGLGRNLGPDFVRIDGRRRLKRYPDGTLAIVDEAKLSGGGAVGPRPEDVGEGVTLNLAFSAAVEGETFIVRPLHETKSCKELGRLANLLDFKTALPFSAKRIGEMQQGELWRLPLTIRLSATPSIGVPITPETSLELHLGVSDQGTVTATLYRLSEKELRFRLRLDRALLKDAGGSINVAVPLS
ncbi:MAG: hypothetical protein HY925_13770, partial [Elusimicrobia bacterium]|nr:hypothetical protein [Elusimicrobiota bacterium]